MLDTFDSGGEGRDKIEKWKKWKKRSDHFFDERSGKPITFISQLFIIWQCSK